MIRSKISLLTAFAFGATALTTACSDSGTATGLTPSNAGTMIVPSALGNLSLLPWLHDSLMQQLKRPSGAPLRLPKSAPEALFRNTPGRLFENYGPTHKRFA